MSEPRSLSDAFMPPMHTAVARVLLVLFVGVHGVLAAGGTISLRWETTVALILMSVSAAVLVLAPSRKLGQVVALAVAGGALCAVGIVVPDLPIGGWPGYAAWPVGAVTFIAIGLALRSRLGTGWLLMSAMTVVTVLWSCLHGAGALPGIDLVVRQFGVVLLGTLFAVGLQRAEGAVESHLAEYERQTRTAGAARADLQARREAVARVLSQVGAALTTIADGTPLSAETRQGLLALEGQLRDEIGLAALLTPDLERSVSAARRRGVDVVLLSDQRLENLPPSVRRVAAEWIAKRLDRTTGQEFVGRVTSQTRATRVSASSDGELEEEVLFDDPRDPAAE